MTENTLLETLSKLADNHFDDLYERSIDAAKEDESIEAELKDAHRRLQLAISRELMDEHQTKLAFRVTIKNLVKRHQKL